MTTFYLIVLSLSAIAIGILSATLGIGGGAFSVPLLVSVGKLTSFPSDLIAQTSVAISLLTAVVLSLSATLVNLRKKKVKFIPALFIVSGSIPGSYTGAVIAQYLSLNQILLIFLFFICIIIAKQILNTIGKKKSSSSNEEQNSKTGPGFFYAALTVIIGFIIGNISSLTGIGGGILIVPVLSNLLGKGHFKEAIATSSFCIILTAIAGLFVYSTADVSGMPEYSIGYIYLPFAIPMMIGAFIGGFAGAKLKGVLPEDKLKMVFVISLILVITKVSYDVLSNS